MNWEEAEQNAWGQLDIPALVEMPTMAERAFLVLSRDWLATAKVTPNDRPMPRDADLKTLACVLLSVEWGKSFTEVAWSQIDVNRATAANRRQPSWADELPWRICCDAGHTYAGFTAPVDVLTLNLDHHNSSIRCWMLEIAWVAFPLLNSKTALEKLYKNIADTLGGVDLAMGLAARFFGNKNDFLADAKAYQPNDYKDQYQDRINLIEENGFRIFQASMWKTEAFCRKKIEEAALGLRMPKGK